MSANRFCTLLEDLRSVALITTCSAATLCSETRIAAVRDRGSGQDMLPNQSRPYSDRCQSYIVDAPAAGGGPSVSGDGVSCLDVARKT